MRLILAAALGLLIGFPAMAQVTTQGGMQNREIKALPAAELNALTAGRGLGLAQAAELNHYPGPTHVLELRAELGLSGLQLGVVQAIHAHSVARARTLGARLVEKERALDGAFRDATIMPAMLGRLTEEIALLRGKLRELHLKAHIETRAVLSPQQIADYDRLRGYTDGPEAYAGLKPD